MERSTAKTVLLVDDFLPVRHLLRLLIEPRYRCIDVASASEAGDVLATCHVDLVLLELGMPRRAGIDFLYELMSRSRSSLVVAMSGSIDPKVADWALRAGAAGYLRKPFSEDVLHSELERALLRDRAVA
jgi:DNA-binding NtrC family response regulator